MWCERRDDRDHRFSRKRCRSGASRIGAPVVGPSDVDRLFHLLEQEWLGERSATPAKREEIDYATIAEAERPAPK